MERWVCGYSNSGLTNAGDDGIVLGGGLSLR